MNTLIIGSGFGSYGYLPAIYNLSERIYLDSKYKKKILNRIELRKCLNKIFWYQDIRPIIRRIDYLIVAQKPEDQDSIVRKLIKIHKPRYIFLEKPISNNPSNSTKLINFLEKNKIKFSVGFLFKYLKWYKFIERKKSTEERFKISWHIKINKKNNSWKYLHEAGGGLTRFYAIHFIRIFYDLKFLKIHKIQKRKNYLYINLLDDMKNQIEFEVKFAKNNLFIVKHNNKKCFMSYNPFLKPIQKKNDPRVYVLNKYLNDIIKNFKLNYLYEKKFIKFWDKIEKKNEYKKL